MSLASSVSFSNLIRFPLGEEFQFKGNNFSFSSTQHPLGSFWISYLSVAGKEHLLMEEFLWAYGQEAQQWSATSGASTKQRVNWRQGGAVHLQHPLRTDCLPPARLPNLTTHTNTQKGHQQGQSIPMPELVGAFLTHTTQFCNRWMWPWKAWSPGFGTLEMADS